MATLAEGITTYAYFVDWLKVDRGHRALKHELHLLDSLIGEPDIATALDALIEKYPEVVKAFPALLALRHKPKDVLRILTTWKGGVLDYDLFDVSGRPCSEAERTALVGFARESGILDLFNKRLVKSVPDYHVGVEVGLDTNGRKNRGGTLMESVCEDIVKEICKRRNWAFKTQVTPAKAKSFWGIDVPPMKTRTKWDIVVYNGSDHWFIECNYFNNGGSKLKATAGEYTARFPRYEAAGYRTLWITDGKGWETARDPLHDAFLELRALINLDMVGRGCLEDLMAP